MLRESNLAGYGFCAPWNAHPCKVEFSAEKPLSRVTVSDDFGVFRHVAPYPTPHFYVNWQREQQVRQRAVKQVLTPPDSDIASRVPTCRQVNFAILVRELITVAKITWAFEICVRMKSESLREIFVVVVVVFYLYCTPFQHDLVEGEPYGPSEPVRGTKSKHVTTLHRRCVRRGYGVTCQAVTSLLARWNHGFCGILSYERKRRMVGLLAWREYTSALDD